MSGGEHIADSIARARTAGRTALVPFLTAGYPEKSTFIDSLREIASIGDVVEVGVPFSDPMADGLTIQRSSHTAIENGVTLRWILDSLEGAAETIDAPVVLMSYLNPLLALGLEALAERAARAGVAGFIVPDLPFEESDEFRATMTPAGLALIQLVTPATPADRRATLAAASRGFVYAVTVTGITGGGRGLPDDTAEYLARVKEAAGETPVCAGFGIRNAADVEAVGRHVDGAIVGSALVEVLEQGGSARDFLSALRP